jgi:hypothetical protein
MDGLLLIQANLMKEELVVKFQPGIIEGLGS